MDATTVRGKDLPVKQTPYTLFNMFSDLSRFAYAIPEDYKDKVKVGEDSIVMNIKGFKLGIKLDKKVPYSLVSFKDDGHSPFPFYFSFHLEPIGLDSTLMHIELSAVLNPLMKMMIGGRLQEFVDNFTDQIAKAMQGEMPDIPKVKPEDLN